jgi:DNA excision repair protein ERCC-4
MRTTIIIDSRERDAGYIDYLRTDYPVEIKFLESGDIIVHDLGIERKTVCDFFATLREGRLFTQLRDMKRTFRRQMLIIEGRGMRFHLDNEPLMALYIRICSGWQIPILHTRDGQHTADVIKRIADQDIRASAGPMRPRPRNPAYAIKEPALRVVTAIPGIGPKRALALITHFRTISAILGAPQSELLKVPGIGRAHAATIRALNHP